MMKLFLRLFQTGFLMLLAGVLASPVAADQKEARTTVVTGVINTIDPVAKTLIDLCISNRHSGHKKAGSSEAVIKDRRSAGRFRAFLVIRHSAAMSSSRLSGRPLASVALKWVQTNSSGFRSGA